MFGGNELGDFFRKILCGIAVGIGCVLPGVSGGVIAISMGLYEKMLSALTNLLKKFKENFLFLLPIGIGCVIGILSTSNILKIVIQTHEAEMFSLFCGFVLGSLPTLFEEIRENGKYNIKPKDIMTIVLAFCALIVIEIFTPSAESSGAADPRLSPMVAMIGGAVLGIGIVIPGLSSSFLLVYIGLYKQIIEAIADLYIPTLFFAGIGFVVGAALEVLLMRFLLKRFHRVSYFAIIGITLGSMTLIIPDIMRGFTWWCIPLCIIGIVFGLWQSLRQIRLQRDVEKKMSEETETATVETGE